MTSLEELISDDNKRAVEEKMKVIVKRMGVVLYKDQKRYFSVNVKIFNKEMITKEDVEIINRIYQKVN